MVHVPIRRKRLLGLVAVLAALWLPVVLYPVHTRDALFALRLRLEGADAVRAATLTGIERDTCRPGEPCRCVALVHGLGDSALTWRRLLWDERGARVPTGHRLVAFDMPGTGDSAPPVTYSQPAQARLLRDAMEQLCPRWTVVGNSLGGWASLWLALEWPEGVERLVLLSPAGLKDPSGASESTARQLSDPTPEALRSFNRRVTHVERRLPERVFLEMGGILRGRPVVANVQAMREAHLLDGRLSALKMPVALLWGESDGIIPPTQVEAFKREMPAAAVTRIPRCGHLPQVECPEPVRAALYGI